MAGYEGQVEETGSKEEMNRCECCKAPIADGEGFFWAINPGELWKVCGECEAQAVRLGGKAGVKETELKRPAVTRSSRRS